MVKDDVPAELTQLEELAESLSGFTHPTKLRAAHILARGEGSGKTVAAELGMPLGQASYHIRQMVEIGLLEPTRMQQARGAVQRFYVLSPLGREWLRRHG
jgi:DNA-binding MarR family transcriptional regulator